MISLRDIFPRILSAALVIFLLALWREAHPGFLSNLVTNVFVGLGALGLYNEFFHDE